MAENFEQKRSYVFEKLQAAFDGALSVIQDSVKKRQPLDMSKDLVEADEDTPESPKELEAVKLEWEAPHELGKYQLPEGIDAPELEDDKTYLLVGSVDRTSFDKKAKREAVVIYKDGADGHDVNWYEDMKGTADMFLKFKDHIETNFKSWESPKKQERLLAILKVVSEMTEFTDAAWQKMIKDNKFTDAEIYGSEGVYNLLLAFNRAKVSTSSGFDLGDFVPGDAPALSPKIFKIRLELAGKAGGKDDNARYSRLISTKVNEDKIKLEEGDEAPAPAKTPEEIEKEKKVADKIAEFEKEGFTFINKQAPGEPSEPLYAIYGKDEIDATTGAVKKFAKRVIIDLSLSQIPNSNNYEVNYNAAILNLPDGHVTTDPNFVDDWGLHGRRFTHVDFIAPDAAIDVKDLKNRLEEGDVKDYSDSAKALYYDFVYAPGYKVTVDKTALTGNDPLTQGPYADHTYKVEVTDTVIDVGTGAGAKRVNVPSAKFEVTLKPGDPMPYTGYDDDGGGIPEAATPAEFLKNAVKEAYTSGL